MPVTPEGIIIDQQGNPTGGKIDVATGQMIDSAALSPAQSPPFQGAPALGQQDISKIDTSFEPTEPEKQAQKQTEDLQNLYNQLIGQEKFTEQQETAQGVPEYKQTLQNYSSQLKGLQNEMEAAQLAYNHTIPNQMEERAKGRGITVGGLEPLTASELRKNQIYQGGIASRMLGIAALFETAKGNLSLALDNVERSVAHKFNPIKEMIAVKQANLDLILNSPAYSLAQKKRAQLQQDIQDKKKRDIEHAEENTKIAQAMAVAAVKYYPNNQAVSFAAQQVLKLDPNDKSYLQKVFQYVGQYQSDPAQTQKDLDAHLIAQGNIEKLKIDLANAPLERTKMLAEINRINQDASLTPLRKEELKASIAEKYAEAARKRNEGNDNKVLSVMDAIRLGVPYGTTVGLAKTMGKIPSDLTNSTKTMIEAAPRVVGFVDKINNEIDNANNGLGPLASRWREFKAGKIGFSDPAFTSLRTNTALLTTLLLRMHVGARGGQEIFHHFKDLIDTSKQSPENLQAALGAIKDYANALIEEKNQTQSVGGTKIKVRNLKTGVVQTYNGTLTPEEARAAGYEIVP